MQRKVLATGAAALAIGIAGCGGSSAPLTRAAFTTQANRACNVAQARAERGRGEVLNQYIVLQRGKASGITALKPPTSLQARYEDYLRVLTARVRLFERYRAAYRASRHVPKALTEQITKMQAQERRAAAALGLVDCKYHG